MPRCPIGSLTPRPPSSPTPEEIARESRPKPAEKASKRGVYLTDAVWDRLQLEVIRKRTTVSTVAEDLLNRNLRRLRIARDESGTLCGRPDLFDPRRLVF